MRLVASPHYFVEEGVKGIGNIKNAVTRTKDSRSGKYKITEMYCGIYSCPECGKDCEFWQEVGPLTAPHAFCETCQKHLFYGNGHVVTLVGVGSDSTG